MTEIEDLKSKLKKKDDEHLNLIQQKVKNIIIVFECRKNYFESKLFSLFRIISIRTFLKKKKILKTVV